MKQEKDENMEQTILKTAEKLFLDKGYALTSTTEIAKESGCNQALVHYYFRTKENLFQKIFETKLRILMRDFAEIETRAASFEERLRMRIEAHFDLIIQNPRLPFLILNEITTNPMRMEALKRELGEFPKTVYNGLQADLDRESALGRIRPVSAKDLILNMLSLNIFPFLIMPLFQNILGFSEEERQVLLEQRKKEVVTTLLNSLRS